MQDIYIYKFTYKIILQDFQSGHETNYLTAEEHTPEKEDKCRCEHSSDKLKPHQKCDVYLKQINFGKFYCQLSNINIIVLKKTFSSSHD